MITILIFGEKMKVVKKNLFILEVIFFASLALAINSMVFTLTSP